MLPQPPRRCFTGLREGGAIHAHGDGSGALQRAADGGAVAEFGERLPRQPLRHQAFQPCQPFASKAASLLQLLKLAQPLAIRRDELGDELLRIEVAAFGIALPTGHLRRQVAQAMPSFSVTTWATAVRTLLCQVRAEKKPARWVASCTLSEKAMTFWAPAARDSGQ